MWAGLWPKRTWGGAERRKPGRAFVYLGRRGATPPLAFQPEPFHRSERDRKAESGHPDRRLEVRFHVDAEDAVGVKIREIEVAVAGHVRPVHAIGSGCARCASPPRPPPAPLRPLPGRPGHAVGPPLPHPPLPHRAHRPGASRRIPRRHRPARRVARPRDRPGRTVDPPPQGGQRIPACLLHAPLRRPHPRRPRGAHGAGAPRTDHHHVQPRGLPGAPAHPRAPGHCRLRDPRPARGRQPGPDGDRGRVPPGAELHVARVAGRAVRVLGRGAARLRPLREPAVAQCGGGFAMGRQLGRAPRAPARRSPAHHDHPGRSRTRPA